MNRLSASAIGLVLVLAACKGEQKPAQDARAAGEILPGSASDAMIPYDTLRSQPPLAPRPVASGKAGANAGDEEAAADDADEAEATPTDAPAVDIPPVTPTEE